MKIITPKIKVGRTVLVGNGPSVLHKQKGNVIDTFDCVVRMNTAIVDGYEKHVGSKTSYRVVNTILQRGKETSVVEKNWLETVRNEKIILKPFKTKDDRDLCDIHPSNTVYKVSETFQKYLSIIRNGYNLNTLTTGFFSILLFIHISDNVSLYGYDFYEKDTSHHYWEDFVDDTIKSKLSNHNIETEQHIIKNILGQ